MLSFKGLLGGKHTTLDQKKPLNLERREKTGTPNKKRNRKTCGKWRPKKRGEKERTRLRVEKKDQIMTGKNRDKKE